MIPLDAFARRSAARRGIAHLVDRGCTARRPSRADPARTELCGQRAYGRPYCNDCCARLSYQEIPDAQDPQALADVAQGLPAGMALPHLEGAPPSHGGPPDDTSPSET